MLSPQFMITEVEEAALDCGDGHRGIRDLENGPFLNLRLALTAV